MNATPGTQAAQEIWNGYHVYVTAGCDDRGGRLFSDDSEAYEAAAERSLKGRIEAREMDRNELLSTSVFVNGTCVEVY